MEGEKRKRGERERTETQGRKKGGRKVNFRRNKNLKTTVHHQTGIGNTDVSLKDKAGNECSLVAFLGDQAEYMPVILATLRPAWATRDSVPKQTQITKIKQTTKAPLGL